MGINCGEGYIKKRSNQKRENSKKLIFISWKNNTPLKRGKFNIPIPRTCDEVTPNFILVPLVSFDKKKNRLG